MSGWFVLAYRHRIGNSELLPAGDADFATLLNFYLVQEAMGVFNVYLRRDPKRLLIPQAMLRNVLRPEPVVSVA